MILDSTQEKGRLEFIARAVLLMLAFDIWWNVLAQAGRYGFRDFNVAHFAWLDLLQPMPSPGLYIGVLLLASVLAVFGALFWRTTISTVAVAGLWTWAWASSLMDSYQHHYYLSLVLVALIGFPKKKGKSEWGFGALCASTAIMYFWAAFAKALPDWQGGAALRIVARGRRDEVESLFSWLGLGSDLGWQLASIGVVLVQILIGAAYLGAWMRGRRQEPSRLLDILCLAGMLGGLSFHIGAEWLGLKIGWFSYYMVVLSVLVLAPNGMWQRLWEKLPKLKSLPFNAPVSLLLLMLGALAMVWVDLPGALGVAILVGLGGVVLMVRNLERAMSYAAGIFMAGGLMLLSFEASNTRWDFYRFSGGDASRVAALVKDPTDKIKYLDAAIFAYQKANQYAPPGESREKQLQRVITIRAQKNADLEN